MSPLVPRLRSHEPLTYTCSHLLHPTEFTYSVTFYLQNFDPRIHADPEGIAINDML